MRNICCCCVFLLLCVSCAVPVDDSYRTSRKPPNVSATSVVASFLQALKEQDFSSAFDNIHTISSDREGYVSRLKLFYENYSIKIIDYRVLATQLFRDTAIVVAEVEVEYINPGESGRRNARYRNSYDLLIHGNRWKIIRDTCIENCRYVPESQIEEK